MYHGTVSMYHGTLPIYHGTFSYAIGEENNELTVLQ